MEQPIAPAPKAEDSAPHATDSSGHHKNLPVIYACSGCSDAGELADRAARLLTQRGAGEMSCLAGIGGRVRHLMGKAEGADRILVIDGCPLNCARKTLELAGFNHFEHLELHRIGLRKGACPPTPDAIAVVAAAGERLLAQEKE